MIKKLFIGLGNPGSKYDGTRHNLGAAALASWVADKAQWNFDAKVNAVVAQITNHKSQITNLIPETGMNESGLAVKSFLKNNKIELKNILILHDDLELPFGEVKLSIGGSAKGHNGVRSIQQHLGTEDIPRLRLGIGREPAGQTVSGYVLSKFTIEEQRKLAEIYNSASVELTGVSSKNN